MNEGKCYHHLIQKMKEIFEITINNKSLRNQGLYDKATTPQKPEKGKV